MNKIDDLEKAMMAKFEKADEEEKLRNMSQAEKLQLKEEEEHAKMVESRFIQKFSPEWRKKRSEGYIHINMTICKKSYVGNNNT